MSTKLFAQKSRNKKEQIWFDEIHRQWFWIGCAADVEHETIWLTQDKISILFEKSVAVISRHIANIFKDGELEKDTSLQKMQKSPNANNSSYRPPIYYNLDIIISVGYRVKSQRGIYTKPYGWRKKKWLYFWYSKKRYYVSHQQYFFFGGVRQKYFCRKIRRKGKCLMSKNIVWHNPVSLVKCNLKRGRVHIIFIIA